MTIAADSRAVLTLAAGPPLYQRLATNLARSFRWWHRDESLAFAIATDHPEHVGEDVRAWAQIVPLDPARQGGGFRAKLHVDELAPAAKTLFVDADCLCVGPLDDVFARFAGRAVGVLGGSMSEGEWFGDVVQVCRRFDVPALPKFNGGVYYIERGPQSDQVYGLARELVGQYDEIGLVRLRNQPNDELLLAIAMAVYGQTAIPDDGSILGDPQACPRDLVVDCLGGRSSLTNPPLGDPQHQSWYPTGTIHPRLVHLLGHFIHMPSYRREELALDLAVRRGWPSSAAKAMATATRYVPQQSVLTAKNVLRPLYHRLFGHRPIVSERKGQPIVR